MESDQKSTIGDRLRALGFVSLSPTYYQKYDRDTKTTTWINLDPLEVYDSNIPAETANRHLFDVLPSRHDDETDEDDVTYSHVMSMLRWLEEQGRAEDGDDEDWNSREDGDADGNDAVSVDVLDDDTDGRVPVVEHTAHRMLAIYTWGKSCRDRCPQHIDHNFNASYISKNHYKGSLRGRDGREDGLQESFLRCREFMEFLEMMVTEIERKGYREIGINCSKGRHRSVAAAEMLKKYYYPNSAIYHNELHAGG